MMSLFLLGLAQLRPVYITVLKPMYSIYRLNEQVLEMVRPAASKLGLESTVEVWGYFVQQCKQRLHVVLCLSPIGNAFRDRLRQNPSLVNCCTIDWFQVALPP